MLGAAPRSFVLVSWALGPTRLTLARTLSPTRVVAPPHDACGLSAPLVLPFAVSLARLPLFQGELYLIDRRGAKREQTMLCPVLVALFELVVYRALGRSFAQYHLDEPSCDILFPSWAWPVVAEPFCWLCP